MLYPVNFQPESPAQANPVIGGMNAGQDFLTQTLKNQMLNQQAQINPQFLQAQLANQLAQNATLNINNKYLPQTDTANIGLTNAQANLANAQTKFFPMTATGGLYRGLGDYMRGAYLMNPAIWASKFQNDPQFQALMASNPYLAKQFTSIMGNSLQTPILPNFNMGMPSVNNQGQGSLPQMSQNPGANVAAPQNQQSQQMPPQTQNYLPSTLQNLYQPTSNDVSAVQDAATSRLTKETVPTQIANQRYYEQSVENLLGQVAPDMPAISQYAGLAGKANMTIDKYAASTNTQSSPQYRTFNNFVTTQLPIISNEMRRAFGGQATEGERESMEMISNPVNWRNNPSLAISKFNTLVNTLRANASALSQSPAQNLNSLKAGIQNPTYAAQNNGIGSLKTYMDQGNNYVNINGRWHKK